MDITNKMTFFCVYCKTRKKFDKFIKVNKIKNKYIIDIKKIVEEEIKQNPNIILYDADTFNTSLDKIGDVKTECCWQRYSKINKLKDIEFDYLLE